MTRARMRGPAVLELDGVPGGYSPRLLVAHALERPNAGEGPVGFHGRVDDLADLEPWTVGDLEGRSGRLLAWPAWEDRSLQLPPSYCLAGIVSERGASLAVSYPRGFRGLAGETGARILPITLARWNRITRQRLATQQELEAAIKELR